MTAPQASRSARPALRSRLVRVLVALLGTALLVVAVASAVSAGRQAASDELDHALRVEASARATALQEYFERAHSVNLLLAHDSAFRRYEPRRAASPPTTTPASERAAEAMAYLEELYPGRIGEACLIDATGTELARVVEGEVAHAHDLSTEEAANPFFGPTMRLPQGRVHQAAPYLSPDTDTWVISNSTPMVADGDTWGLVHFEVDLASFLPTAPETESAEAGSVRAAIVDSRTGEVVLAGGAAFEPGVLAGVPPAALRALTADRAGQSTATVGGRRLIAVPVPVEADNANRWSVVSLAPADAQAWYRSVGPAPVSTAVAAILLLLLAGLSLRASQREVHAASLTDDLTGLPNRRLLADRLDQALLLSRRRGTTCAVMLIDLDRFKEVNDTLGHQHGDELLRCVANRLLGHVPRVRHRRRLGGDEFAVLMPEVVGAAAVVDAGPPLRGGPARALPRRRHRPERRGERRCGAGTAARAGRRRTDAGRATWRCTRPRSARAGSSSTTPRSTCTRPPASRCSATCGVRCSATSWSCTTSRRWTWRPRRSAASRPSSAGSTRSADWCRPRTSCRSPRAPA